MGILNDERGLVYAYLELLAVVVGVAIAWIVLNAPVEQVLSTIENTGLVSSQGMQINGLLRLGWRIFPIVIFIAAAIWAFTRAHKEEPFVAAE